MISPLQTSCRSKQLSLYCVLGHTHLPDSQDFMMHSMYARASPQPHVFSFNLHSHGPSMASAKLVLFLAILGCELTRPRNMWDSPSPRACAALAATRRASSTPTLPCIAMPSRDARR